MILAIAAGLALVISLLGTAVLGLALTFAFGVPFVVALPMLMVAYVGAWFVIPVCLTVNLICAAVSRNDMPIHVSAVAIAVLLWLLWGALFPNRTTGNLPYVLITASAAIVAIPAHWAMFLWAQRRRRGEAVMPQAAP